jgi:hypothetical protein
MTRTSRCSLHWAEVRLPMQGQHAQGQVRQTDQEPWQEWSIQNEMGWRRDVSCLALRQATPFVYQCVASASGHHLCNRLSHSVSVIGSTGTPEAERPQGRKQPAQVKSGGKLEPTRQPRRETRVARSKLHCLKPNPERMTKGPAETLVRRRRGSGADPM